MALISLPLLPTWRCQQRGEKTERKKSKGKEAEREQSVYVGAEACKTDGWFIMLGKTELILRGDARRERREQDVT